MKILSYFDFQLNHTNYNKNQQKLKEFTVYDTVRKINTAW